MKFIPNQNTYVGFTPALSSGSTVNAPKLADFNNAVDLTNQITGITATTTGNSVPTPTLDSLFETSIAGTASGQFQLDGYYDTIVSQNLVWTTLPRGTSGCILLARYGGKPTAAGAHVEVWPIQVTSRAVQNMTSGQVVSTNVTASVPSVPGEDAVVAA